MAKNQPLANVAVFVMRRSGDADIAQVLRSLKCAGYRGDFVLQAARGADDVAAARRYREQLVAWLAEAGF